MRISRLSRMNTLLAASFLCAVAVVLVGGLKQQETPGIITLLVTLSTTMGGFGLVAFQVAHASNELRSDFIESSILMILSTITGFFYLVYPALGLFHVNFGELSILLFFWAFILFLIILVDKRLNVLR